MVGHGRPIARTLYVSRLTLWQSGWELLRRWFLAALVIFHLGASLAFSAEQTVRLRFAWGSDRAAKQRWTGTITIPGATLTQLRPLGIETDAAVAMRIEGDHLIVAPLEKRGFDGCDLLVTAEETVSVQVKLQSEQAPQPTVFQAPLAQLADSQLSEPLDEFGSFFLAHRSPGDKLRVSVDRDHLVFAPGEPWKLRLQPDLSSDLAAGPLQVEVHLRATGTEKVLWNTSQQVANVLRLDDGMEFDIESPATEGAYRLTIVARPEEGLATRFVPGQQAKAVASREVEFVVVDPQAKLPQLVDSWTEVLTIDPANPRWWQRLPTWAQVPRLRERNVGAVGNVRPVVRPLPAGEIVELPAQSNSSDPAWQSYTLPIREPGRPHLVELEYPASQEQHLSISIVEPDAAGRVTKVAQDASLYHLPRAGSAEGEMGVHRFVFWPRSRSPQVLLVNRHHSQPAQYGKIKLSQQQLGAESREFHSELNGKQRLVAAYLSQPSVGELFGATELRDPGSGLSVQGWSTFLQSGQRLAQMLKLQGYNGIMLAVASDGSALYPSEVLNPSPRFDTGRLASSGQDPLRKDVLEMLLRIFDREGLRVVPTVQFAAPLPELERLRQTESQPSGIECVNYQGKSWLQTHSTSQGRAPYYNPLNDQVQTQLFAIIQELAGRYGKHPSLAGVGVQLAGEGYGLMPGLTWGLDDRTVAEFSSVAGVNVPGRGEQRFLQRANYLLGEKRTEWLSWRSEKLCKLYTRMADQLHRTRDDLRLVLTTESLFTGDEFQQAVRSAIASPTDLRECLREHALDLEHLQSYSSVTVMTTYDVTPADELRSRAVQLRINQAVEQKELISAEKRQEELFFTAADRFRLPSFDERSPYGIEQTFLSVGARPELGGVERRRGLFSSLAREDLHWVVMGGDLMSATLDNPSAEIHRTLQALPANDSELHSQRQQPVVMRVYRVPGATVLALINECPWPLEAKVGVSGSNDTQWQKLGSDSGTAPAQPIVGSLGQTEQIWQIQLRPFDLQAWRFEDEKLRVGELSIEPSDLAKQDLQQRIEAIEVRTGNLNIEREYNQLQNPGFELQEPGVRIVGWQPRQGSHGSIDIETASIHSGSQALRLRSMESTGVAVQSHLFPAPNTGQLMVTAFVRVLEMSEDAQLQITLQDQNDGGRYRQFAAIRPSQVKLGEWSRFDLALSDVPSGGGEQLRLSFHLLGNAEVLLDDVKLCDLRFDEARRRSLVKRVFAARVALEQDQLVDCLRVVDDYWSQYLVEHVPPAETVTFQATKPTPKTAVEAPEEETGIGSRLRGWVPKLWR